MINAEGDETKNEWVTLFNFGRSEMDLTNWSLSDGKRPPLALQTSIRPGEGKRIDYLYDESNNVGVRLSNKSGRIELLTPDNAIADRVTYSKQSHMIREGLPVKFNLDEHVVGPSFRSEL